MIHTYYVLIYGTRNVLLMLQCNPKFESFPARTSKLPSEDLRGIIARGFFISRSADFKVIERGLARDIDILLSPSVVGSLPCWGGDRRGRKIVAALERSSSSLGGRSRIVEVIVELRRSSPHLGGAREY